MLPMCICANWYHEDCLNLKEHDRVGEWPCPSCRQMNQRIERLIKNCGLLSFTDNWDETDAGYFTENTQKT